jgi:hypothetical protein
MPPRAISPTSRNRFVEDGTSMGSVPLVEVDPGAVVGEFFGAPLSTLTNPDRSDGFDRSVPSDGVSGVPTLVSARPDFP